MTDSLPQKILTTPLPANETERLAALHRYKILDTPPEAAFDRITALAARLFNVPTALISLVDESRAWFKSCIGFDAREVSRYATLCSFAVLSDEPLIVPDAQLDDRFACNPFVQSEPGVRFYAGAPLLSQDGFNLGTLCLLDGQPRNSLSAEQQAILVDLAAMVVDELELRFAAYKIAQVDTALLEITQGVATVTGEAYFDTLVQHFAKVLDADYAYIGLIESDAPKMLRTIATCAHGQIVDNLEYPLQDTPCWEVIEQRKICCYPRNVQAQFPNAPLLKPLVVESYVAIPFFDSSGIPLGLLGVMDGKPLENVQLAESLLTIFALRIATELERQQTEAALRESEAKYRNLFNSMDEGYFLAEVIFDEDDHPVDIFYLEANPAVLRITGLDLAGRRLRELDSNFESHWWETFGRVVQTGVSKRGELYAEPLKSWYNYYVSRTDDVDSRRVTVLFQDVTDRKKAEQERDRFLAVGSDLQVITGSNGYFQWVSPTFERTLGWTIDEMISRPLTDFVHPDDINPSVSETASLFSGRETFAFENRYQHKDGSYRWFLWNAQLYPDEQVIYGTAIDITDRKRTEQNAELLANVSQSLVEAISVDEIVQTVGEQLHRYLKTSICAFVEINETQDEVAINYNWHQDDVPSIVGVYSILEFVTDEFLQAAKAGQQIVVRDVTSDPRIVDPQRYAPLKIGAEINVPLIRDGEWKFSLTVFHQTPYNWRTDEIELMRELAIRIWNRLERTRAEAALRESEARLRFMLNASQIGDWDLDLTTQPHTAHRSLRHDQIFGYESLLPEWSYEIFLTHVHPDDRAAVNEKFQQTLSASTDWNFECRIIHPDQSLHWIWVRSSVYCDQSGTPTRLLGMVLDVTDRKQAEAALQEQTQLLQLIIDSMGDGLILANPQGQFVLVNQAAERIFGRLTNERSCDGWSRTYGLFLPDQQTFFPDEQLPLYRAIRGEYANDVEVFVRCDPVSEGRWISISGFPVLDATREITGGVITCRDITDRKRILQQEQAAREAAERANRIKDEFLAVLSHELRSPLNPILGWTRLLQNGKLDAARQAEALKTIERNAKLQTQLIEDLLDISRIMQGKLSLTAAPVSLTFVISSAIETVRLAAEAKNIQITLDLNPEIASIFGDAARLQQVVWNLLTNAVKFTPNGGQVTVELRQLDRLAQIRVIDKGKGITPSFLPHVFEYFRQEDGSTTRKFGGLGLGLAIVRQIVEMHGGTVRAESQGENQGVTFIVQLPAMQQAALTVSEPSTQADTEMPLDNVQILLVDDETDTREFQAFLLEQSGANVTAVASGLEALRALDQFIPDAIVSDVGMAEMDGYMLMQQIRLRPADQGGTIPAIALTAYASEVDQQKALQVGFQAHITKPVEPEALVKAIANLCLRK